MEQDLPAHRLAACEEDIVELLLQQAGVLPVSYTHLPARSIAGCAANGIPEAVAQSIYDEIYDFANYAFNKAHAVCYAVVAYQTAWFKCHHPKEYMAALLTSVLDSSDKVAE